MIAANYSVHLYCDCIDCNHDVFSRSTQAEYQNESWTRCANEARKDGWRISKDRERAYAPGHKIKRGAA